MEYPYACPFCWEQNTVLIDLSATPASLIEDCHVCCQPIQLEVSVSIDGIAQVQASRSD